MYLPTTVGGQPFPSATNRLKVHVLMTQVGDLNDLIDMTQDYTDAVLGFSPNQSNSYTLVNGGLTMWVKFTYTKEQTSYVVQRTKPCGASQLPRYFYYGVGLQGLTRHNIKRD